MGEAVGTPIGERPAGGGRVREYASGAERARAWRERQRERQAASPTAAVPALLAEASLAATVERLVEVLGVHRGGLDELVGRVEEAVAVLGDPELVADELAAVRAETARDVATATEKALRATQQRSAAEARAGEAEVAGNQAWERVEILESELAAVRAAGDEQRLAAEAAEALLRAAADAAAVEAAERLAALRTAHQDQLEDAEGAHRVELEVLSAEHETAVAGLVEEHAAALEAARATYETEVARWRQDAQDARQEAARAREEAESAGQARARAEGTTVALDEELSAVRKDLESARAEIPRAVTAAQETADRLHQAEVVAVRAGHDAELAKLTARADTAQARANAARELADNYRSQLEDRPPASTKPPTPEPS